MKRIVLIGTLLLLLVFAAGTASARVILPPGWPFLPPIITPPVIEVSPPAYYHGYHGYRGPGYWGHGGQGYSGPRDHGYRGHEGRGYYGSRSHQGHGGYRR
jgi:hypothetical protein